MPASPKREGFEFWEKTLGKPRLLVAPMVDQSELPWRLLSRRHGAQLCYTPMYHAAVFARDPHYRSEALASCQEDRPLIVQFSANDPEDFLRAALLAQDHCDAVDLNLGCPQANAKRGRYGAFLQEDWDTIFKIVNLAHQRLAVPVTCKIRVYQDVEKTVQYAKMLEQAGCQMLTVHGRTRDMKGPKTGLANWDVIKAIKESLSIPVFANGNIQYKSDVERCMRETGVDGVMTAEGNLHNPAIFEGVQPPAWEMAEEYLELVKQYPCPMAFVRGHLFKIWHHSVTIHQDLRTKMANAKTLEDFVSVSQDLRRVCEAEMMQASGQEANGRTPHWLCQPYVRPTPEETQKRMLEKSLKRPLTENEQENQEPHLSKRALKKHQRGKPLVKIGRKFDPCSTCSNPRGLRCVFKLCRACCKEKARHAVEDCPSHRFLFKSKIERRKHWEAEQAAKASLATSGTPTDTPTDTPKDTPTDTPLEVPGGTPMNVDLLDLPEGTSEVSRKDDVKTELRQGTSRDVCTDNGVDAKPISSSVPSDSPEAIPSEVS
ncbi:tRNA-dihydrouridine(16/17) synthase [NAD(P)(+)]-like isoform X1 [Patiria miniata]|uniref:tRNA-dihydrouridine(16/17) synthase [NAD(P)(+)] n=1 Tax=Patiria miniata TaxID=46514 RepID=A0A914ALI0_PATMI|nr:tRNA-dihydrouridine(16/17) synthase [NAD(P)(+)]-like isoform X1 [Patiria miniata]XP_038064433.1 tRNA-dihydrouridine(16/17) synthase [NAD(P)(+)]-like isoform X1 [Patiria miniata]XP_038064435.1 tRNA-dihydrouridine(16/17) synthase [NAD(P)(+)]-like isoform X1 [Patiria miniata]